MRLGERGLGNGNGLSGVKGVGKLGCFWKMNGNGVRCVVGVSWGRVRGG